MALDGVGRGSLLLGASQVLVGLLGELRGLLVDARRVGQLVGHPVHHVFGRVLPLAESTVDVGDSLAQPGPLLPGVLRQLLDLFGTGHSGRVDPERRHHSELVSAGGIGPPLLLS